MSAQDFFSTVSTFATPFAKVGKGGKRDPLLVARIKFAASAAAQIKLINEAVTKGFWFKKQDDQFVITLKNGSSTLNLDHPSFAVGSITDAVKFLEKARAAASAGEFDALFLATSRKVKATPTATTLPTGVEGKSSPSGVVSTEGATQIAPTGNKSKRK